MKPSVVDLTGLRFGMLVVVAYAGSNQKPNRRGSMWECLCDCGNRVTASLDILKKGERKTCGCSTQAIKHRTHGQSKTRTYSIWILMIRRCHRPAKEQENSNYHSRGIRVCDAWVKSFAQFASDMGPCPPGHQIDRIDNNGNYEPSNCRWASPKEQGRNKRSNRTVSFRGRSQCISAWAEETGINEMTLWKRIDAGWPAEQALTQPVKQRSF